MRKQFFYALVLSVLFTGMGLGVKAQNGSSNQFVEMEYGTTDIAYPAAYQKARSGECGGGWKDIFFPDYVLIYNTPARGKGNPDNIKFWSNLSHVRWAMNTAYGGRLSATGLRTGTTRVCIGSAGRHLSLNDFHYIYLWRKR